MRGERLDRLRIQNAAKASSELSGRLGRFELALEVHRYLLSSSRGSRALEDLFSDPLELGDPDVRPALELHPQLELTAQRFHVRRQVADQHVLALFELRDRALSAASASSLPSMCASRST